MCNFSLVSFRACLSGRAGLCGCLRLEMMSSLSKESWKSGTNASHVAWFYKTQCSLLVDIGKTETNFVWFL